MARSETDSITKEINLLASPARVWRAISDSAEFGEWFGARIEGPFREGETITCRNTHPDFDNMKFHIHVERMAPEQGLSFRWCPYAMDPDVDYSGEPTTLVEFSIEKAGEGTLLRVTESGFDGIPEQYRRESFLRNESGWSAQVENIKRHVDG